MYRPWSRPSGLLSLEKVQELIRSVKCPEIIRILRTTYSIRIYEGILVSLGAVDGRSTQDTNAGSHGDEVVLQLPGRESYPVIKETREELQIGPRLEDTSTKTDHQDDEAILSYATVMLDQGVRTETCSGCSHPGFASEPRSPPRQYLEPGDLIFSGLNGPDGHVPAMAVILKLRPTAVPGPDTYCAADLADLLSDRRKYCHNCFCVGFEGGDDALRGRAAALTVLDILTLEARARDVVQLGHPCHHARTKGHMRSQHELHGAQLVTVSTSLRDVPPQDTSTSGLGGGDQ